MICARNAIDNLAAGRRHRTGPLPVFGNHRCIDKGDLRHQQHWIPVGRSPAAPPLVKVRTYGISANPCRQSQASAQQVTPAFPVIR